MTAPVRVYVAAPFSEWKLAREVQAALRAEEAVITEDWTAGIENLPVGMTDADTGEDAAMKAAILDIEGVLRADACIFLTVTDKTLGRGMYVELGAAIVARGLNKLDVPRAIQRGEHPRIAVCGPHRDATIFSRLGKRFAAWKDALPYVLGRTT